VLGLYSLDRFQYRFVRSDEGLLALLPDGDSTLFFARVDLLRRAGMLQLIAGARSTDPEYEAFVRATRFDYAKDVDALAGSVNERGTFITARGRFDWRRIQAYVRTQGGACNAQSCTLHSNGSQGWIGMILVQPDVIGVALGKQESPVSAIHPGQQTIPRPFPVQPVWVKLAPYLLNNPSSVPVALRIFLISLQSCHSVMLAVNRGSTYKADTFNIELSAQCPSAVTADTARKQLEIQTKMLKLELGREHEQPNPADLTGLLTSGTFDTSGTEVRGLWPVRKELLKTLQ
jgi:hypothetical protein